MYVCMYVCYIIRGHVDASKLVGYPPLTWSAGMVYIWGVGAAQGHGDVEYYTRGTVRWVGGVHCRDMGAMKAEGQARLEPPRTPGYAYTDYCLLAVGYVDSGLVGYYEYADGNGFRGVTGDRRLHGGGGTRTTESPLLLRRMRAALFLGCRFAPDREALAFCLL